MESTGPRPTLGCRMNRTNDRHSRASRIDFRFFPVRLHVFTESSRPNTRSVHLPARVNLFNVYANRPHKHRLRKTRTLLYRTRLLRAQMRLHTFPAWSRRTESSGPRRQTLRRSCFPHQPQLEITVFFSPVDGVYFTNVRRFLKTRAPILRLARTP